MSLPQNTPEFRLARTDSKNPETTCWGLRVDGRKCRRTVVSAKSSPSPSPSKGVNSGNGEIGDTSSVLLCWQHKTQAVLNTTPSRKPAQPASQPEFRSSIETLVERVGLLDVNDRERPASAGNAFKGPFARWEEEEWLYSELRPGGHTPQRHGTRRHSINTPGRHVFETENDLLSSPESSSSKYRFGSDVASSISGRLHRRTISNNPPKPSHLSSRLPVVQPVFQSADTTPRRSPRLYRESDVDGSSQLRVPQPSTPVSRPQSSPLSQSPARERLHRPSLQGSPASTQSHTDSLLSWIPNTLSPMTTSALLKKLSEPISNSEKPGYIYLCCVTPQMQTASPPPAHLAQAPRPTSTDKRESRRQRTSDTRRSAGATPNKVSDSQLNDATNMIILKIGRTENVYCRMNKWKRDCARNLTLMRYYPHVSSSSSVDQGVQVPPYKVPHAHRVEELVLLELEDRKVKLEKCWCCGKRHQEWFEISAEREQLRTVDECVRRWVRWSEVTLLAEL
ncbi:hypothetical protein ACJ72_08306 [Emergomyces africanus]|uniref:Bacteriophage T5 Orf172 DNA-binding domain-containing protein n=1 Tax=Emergomyces africanus TaxID=1955775 RepID=A0A1B7NL27_9EURO|nr:hypothetical protein ACJ72_08306 [Emergomyces africanus]